ncbi:MAG: DUF2080 family transposase-associated protein [Candidatus Marsarchaeota archaeon]|nr:DUF2080 family transposase-associated protein [Candidatus Marsarchaeota archaeon]MCL5106019.1 DUF2080 family transposase-associated protein [Candidatus Marsarchaeota archaeon]
MQKNNLSVRNLKFDDNNVLCFFEKRVTKFGTGAKIDCSKQYLNKKVYVVVLKNNRQAGLKTTDKKRKQG